MFVVRLAPEGDIASHVVAPLTPVAVAENAVLLEAVTETDCVGGVAPPAVALKTREGGVAVKLDVVVEGPLDSSPMRPESFGSYR